MQPISIDQLKTRTEAEISILFGLCNAVMTKAPPLGPKWRAAHGTAHNIMRLRRSRFAPYRPGG